MARWTVSLSVMLVLMVASSLAAAEDVSSDSRAIMEESKQEMKREAEGLLLQSHRTHRRSNAMLQLRDEIRRGQLKKVSLSQPHLDNLPAKWLAKKKEKSTLVFGHRGCFQAAQENTLEGFQAALDLGADGVEFDVVADADGELWLYHDQYADSLLGVVEEGKPDLQPAPKKMIWDMKTAEVEKLRYMKTLDYSSPKKQLKQTYKTTPKLAKFKDVLDFAKRTGLLLDVELKKKGNPEAPDDPKNPDPQVVKFGQDVADLLKEKGMVDQVVVTAFTPVPLESLKQRLPAIKRGFGYDDYFPKTKVLGFIPFDSGAKIGKANQFFNYGKDDARCEKVLSGDSKIVNGFSPFWIKVIDKFMLGKYNDVVTLKLPTISRNIVNWFHSKGTPVGAYTAFPIDQRWNERWTSNPLTEDEELRVAYALFEIGIDWVESDNIGLLVQARERWAAQKKTNKNEIVRDIPDLEFLKQKIPQLDLLQVADVQGLLQSARVPGEEWDQIFSCKKNKDGQKVAKQQQGSAKKNA